MIHRIGIGTDLHRLEPGSGLRLGGVDVPHDKRLSGHSDGDIVCHALIDALCGAAGLPDIGEQFPDTDPQWRGVDSTKLLEKIVERVRDLGYAAVNVDIVIHAERPKLSPMKAAIAERLAELLGLDAECVSVKAKTNEGVDAVGRGDAMACTAIAGLRRV
ncbi:MAG: 2-C-methyl-D-erythritol 2,4-cyclodiphosphate synthase [Phycisphaerales bacterium]|nr:2-C-methyl-D-erythritol 2,4-cyclodiphosphate synthase [Phycisphaerales bacterium]MCB9856237.1 2-C-methyl-D-erythritol 2,4-cyclodiphosphate synthase [Phycisphaerales bacterium]MCB9863324.1 2-C-methyl-D-erythritol 2,4-cyclodiphosphate synthase [Phycisphaerales bacterium]